MSIHHAQLLIKQFLHNLDEADWVSRHVADGSVDLPQSVNTAGPDRSVSSLSLALQQMGLVRQSTDNGTRYSSPAPR